MTDLPLYVVRHLVAGEPTGPTVVLLHGFASRGSIDWPDDRWAIPLLATGRDVLLVDLPGHGGSVPIDAAADPSTSRIVAAIASAISGSRGGGIDLVGYSLGARLAWALAGASPLPVRHLVLGGLSPFEPFAGVDQDAVRRFGADGTLPADPISTIIGQMAFAPGNDGESLLHVIAGLASEPFDPGSGTPGIPTLVVAGADDPMAGGGEAIAAAVPGSQLAVVPGDHLAALAGDGFRSAAFAFLGV